jgi:hypothetical protein
MLVLVLVLMLRGRGAVAVAARLAVAVAVPVAVAVGLLVLRERGAEGGEPGAEEGKVWVVEELRLRGRLGHKVSQHALVVGLHRVQCCCVMCAMGYRNV